MIQIVNASPTLNESAFAIKQDLVENEAIREIAARLGVPLDHTAVRLIADTWTVLFATAFRGMGTPGEDPIEAEALCARLTATFDEFVRLTSPRQPDGQPPGGASQ
jgi:hypothetical protein